MTERNAPPQGSVSFVADMLGERELIVLTGGGGKTSLLFALAHCLQREASVVTTTTTHICRPRPEETSHVLLGVARWDEWRSALSIEGHITIAESENGDKLRGFPPEVVDEMYRRKLARYLVVEADGAKRMPFKAYEEYEPVLPRAATLHIVVIGVEPFLYPIVEENTFRLHLLARRHGIEPGERVLPERVADILDDPREYMKEAHPKTRRILLVNKCDMVGAGGIASIRDVLSARLRFYDLVLFASLRENILYDCVRIDRARGDVLRS